MRNIKATAAPLWVRKQKGRRYGKLQIIGTIGTDQNSGEHIFECRCMCGKFHQLSMAQIQNDRNWSCTGCNPQPVKQETNVKAEYKAEQSREAQAIATAKATEQQRIAAEQQRIAAELAEKQRVAHRKRVEEFLGGTFEEIMGTSLPQRSR
jgi:hypothetical protein